MTKEEIKKIIREIVTEEIGQDKALPVAISTLPLGQDKAIPVQIVGDTGGGGGTTTFDDFSYDNLTKILSLTIGGTTKTVDLTPLAEELQNQINDIVNGGFVKDVTLDTTVTPNQLSFTKNDGTFLIVELPSGGGSTGSAKSNYIFIGTLLASSTPITGIGEITGDSFYFEDVTNILKIKPGKYRIDVNYKIVGDSSLIDVYVGLKIGTSEFSNYSNENRSLFSSNTSKHSYTKIAEFAGESTISFDNYKGDPSFTNDIEGIYIERLN